MGAQGFLIVTNVWDLFWTTRANLRIGVPDAFFIFGDEVLSTIVDRLFSMPMYIFAARLCPKEVEATMFALIMGPSNFGHSTGVYIGGFLLEALEGSAPRFDNLTEYVAIRSLCRVLVLFLIPLLVPKGSPSDSDDGGGARSTASANTGEVEQSGVVSASNIKERHEQGAIGAGCEKTNVVDAALYRV